MHDMPRRTSRSRSPPNSSPRSSNSLIWSTRSRRRLNQDKQASKLGNINGAMINEERGDRLP